MKAYLVPAFGEKIQIMITLEYLSPEEEGCKDSKLEKSRGRRREPSCVREGIEQRTQSKIMEWEATGRVGSTQEYKHEPQRGYDIQRC